MNHTNLNDPKLFSSVAHRRNLTRHPQYAQKTINILFVTKHNTVEIWISCMYAHPALLRSKLASESLPVCVVRHNVGALSIISVIIYDKPGAGWCRNT